LRKNEATKGLAFLLFAERLFIGVFLFLSEGVEGFDGFSELVAYLKLLLSRFARVRVADLACVLCAISFCEINIAVAAQFATQFGD
jgi:hypothetical protein